MAPDILLIPSEIIKNSMLVAILRSNGKHEEKLHKFYALWKNGPNETEITTKLVFILALLEYSHLGYVSRS